MLHPLKMTDQKEHVTTDTFLKYGNKRIQSCNSWKNFFDQPVKNDTRTYGNIRTVSNDQWVDWTSDLLLSLYQGII